MRAALCRVLRAEPHELSALAWAFAYFFLLLCSYYLLRPVRDALAVEAGTEKLPWLFTGTFAAMLALVPAFGWLCARLSRARARLIFLAQTSHPASCQCKFLAH